MANVNGQYFLINKHKIQKGGRKRRRRFYTEAELDEARTMGAKYAAENNEDYLIVQGDRGSKFLVLDPKQPTIPKDKPK